MIWRTECRVLKLCTGGAPLPNNHQQLVDSLISRTEIIERVLGTAAFTDSPKATETVLEVIDGIKAELANVAALPPGSVIASSARCAGKWQPFTKAEGKFIAGVGQGELEQGIELLVPGGDEYMHLSIRELPSHQHGTVFAANPKSEADQARRAATTIPGWGLAFDGAVNVIKVMTSERTRFNHFLTRPEGAGQRFRLMPPYLGLHFCVLED